MVLRQQRRASGGRGLQGEGRRDGVSVGCVGNEGVGGFGGEYLSRAAVSERVAYMAGRHMC